MRRKSHGVITVITALALMTAPQTARGVSDHFIDDDDSTFEADIDAIAAAGITKGCNPPHNDQFCPTIDVARGEMAAFLRRALRLPPAGTDFFADDDGSTFEADINAIAAAGITKGCDPPHNDRFCPEDPVDRGAMAAFLRRGLNLPSSAADAFGDDEHSTFEADIDAIAAAGITKGCNPPHNDGFCPEETVDRGAMAAFLRRGLHLPSELPPRDSRSVELYVYAKSGFDEYTKNPSERDRAWMRDHYEFMAVWSPYFDSRLSWFSNAVEYSDIMGLKDLEQPEWVLRNSSGDFLYVDFACSGGKCPQYAADIGNPAYRRWFISHLKGQVAKGYSGVFLDDVNMSWRISDGTNDVEPIDPRTGKTMTLDSWRRYMADFVEQIEREVSGIAVHNPIWAADSPDFDDPSVVRQLAAADWVQIEHGFNDQGLKGGNSRFSVRNLFAYVDWVHSLGTKVMWLEEDGGSDAKHESNLAAYLLTYAPGDVISTEDWAAIAPDTIWEGYLLELGAPLGARTLSEGLFRRQFQHGIVLVNEPDNDTKTVHITGTRIDGTSVSQVSIPPGTGIIIKHD